MIKTVWKPRSELELALRDVKRVAIVSCGTCANILDTGGETGLRVMRDQQVLCWTKGVSVRRFRA